MSPVTYYNKIQITNTSLRIALGEPDDATKKALEVNFLGDYYDIIAHGSAYHMYVRVNGQQQTLDAAEVYAILRTQRDYFGLPIRLVSCSVGREPDGFAQQLANLAGVPVLAATAKIFAEGRELHFYDPRDFGLPLGPDDLGPKEWIIFHPQTNA